jgi:GTP cyclohydrolase IA
MAGVECKDRTGASAQICLELQMNDVLRLPRSCANSITPDSTRSPAEIEQAFRDVFRWIGEDPDRDGLRETPGRLVRAYQEYFSGYRQDPEQILRKTFEETDGYDEMVVLRGIPFESHC